MVKVPTFVARLRVMSDINATVFMVLWLGHHGLPSIAVIHGNSVIANFGRMCHRARKFHRSRHALHGQRHDQYPEHDNSN
jgi:hypothetical protein